ncbi:MAG: hypothetical protein H7321_06515 [Bacteroidia bacterium]|nr:hypothetical protein [Bacteroidia bacterium]
MKTIVFAAIFVVGEFAVNKTLFRYLKKYFKVVTSEENSKPFAGFNISLFKGMLERFVIFFALVLNLSQILIVFGAIKIGTRLNERVKVQNDYFIIGNFLSIFLSISYYECYQKII